MQAVHNPNIIAVHLHGIDDSPKARRHSTTFSYLSPSRLIATQEHSVDHRTSGAVCRKLNWSNRPISDGI